MYKFIRYVGEVSLFSIIAYSVLFVFMYPVTVLNILICFVSEDIINEILISIMIVSFIIWFGENFRLASLRIYGYTKEISMISQFVGILIFIYSLILDPSVLAMIIVLCGEIGLLSAYISSVERVSSALRQSGFRRYVVDVLFLGSWSISVIFIFLPNFIESIGNVSSNFYLYTYLIWLILAFKDAKEVISKLKTDKTDVPIIESMAASPWFLIGSAIGLAFVCPLIFPWYDLAVTIVSILTYSSKRLIF